MRISWFDCSDILHIIKYNLTSDYVTQCHEKREAIINARTCPSSFGYINCKRSVNANVASDELDTQLTTEL